MEIARGGRNAAFGILQTALASKQVNAIMITALSGMWKPPRRSQPRRDLPPQERGTRSPHSKRLTVTLLLEVRVLPPNLLRPVKVQINQKAEGDAGKAKLR